MKKWPFIWQTYSSLILVKVQIWQTNGFFCEWHSFWPHKIFHFSIPQKAQKGWNNNFIFFINHLFLAGQWNCHKRQLTVADINSVSSQWNSEETLVPMHFSLILFQENSFPFNFYWFHFCFKGERKLYTKKIKKGFYCRFRKFEKCISRSFSKPFLSLLIIYLHNNLMYQMPQKKFCN